MNRAIGVILMCAWATLARGADLTGTWQIQYRDDDGVSRSSPKLILQQSGDKLTGKFGKNDWPVTGAVDRDHVVFIFTAFGHENGQAISDTVFYWGDRDSTGKMKGRMKNPKEAGDWVATKVE